MKTIRSSQHLLTFSFLLPFSLILDTTTILQLFSNSNNRIPPTQIILNSENICYSDNKKAENSVPSVK